MQVLGHYLEGYPELEVSWGGQGLDFTLATKNFIVACGEVRKGLAQCLIQ